MRWTWILLCALSLPAAAQDSIRVHFLYGSKPAPRYRQSEPKWFGGMLGGHVGVAVEEDRIFNFCPSGKVQVFQQRKRNSRFAWHSASGFYSILGGSAAEAKRTVIAIPITAAQRRVFDSIAAGYAARSPYNYAVFGMRCGAAGYDILAQLGILPQHSIARTWKKIFYPRKLRKRLLRRAEKEGWRVERMEGTARRIWERDAG